MKKKWALLCMAGLLMFGMSACGNEKADATTQEPSETDTVESEEGTDAPAETEKVSDKEDYVAIQDLDIEEYITLTDYENMTVSVVKTAVDDAAVENYINSEILSGLITDRAVEDGDVVDIDYVGKEDGVAFDRGSAEGYKLAVGSGTFIPGFEDGLIGVMPGETIDLNLTFPEDYGNADMAGKEVVFTVTVNGIECAFLYEDVTVQDLERLGLAYETKEAVWEAGLKGAQEDADEAFAENAKSAILQKLVEESVAESIPDYLIEEEAQGYNTYMESVASMYGMDLESFVTLYYGMTMDEYNEELNEMCIDTVKCYLVIEAAARRENIEITEDTLNEKAAEEAPLYGYESAQQLLDDVGYTVFRMYLLQDIVLDRLLEVVTVEEA